MSRPSQTARRQDRTRIRTRYGRFPVPVLLLGIVLGLLAWAVYPRSRGPLGLTYEIDLAQAPQGQLTMTMILEGDLPGDLDLQVLGGSAGGDGPQVQIHAPLAAALTVDGLPVSTLDLQTTATGWRLGTRGARRVGVIYQVDLSRTSSQVGDVRRHLSTLVPGGVRAAGFEIFLAPVRHPVGPITVAVHNPGQLPFLVPWPALIKDGQGTAGIPPDRLIQPAERIQPANLAFGMGYRPAAGVPAHADSLRTAGRMDTYPVPANLMFHPRDLADLNNALLVCGDIRTLTGQAGDCVIQLATDRHWLFADEAAMDLVRRIARTEMGFFGSAPDRPDHGAAVGQRDHRQRALRRLRRAHRQFGAGHAGSRHHVGHARGAGCQRDRPRDVPRLAGRGGPPDRPDHAVVHRGRHDLVRRPHADGRGHLAPRARARRAAARGWIATTSTTRCWAACRCATPPPR